MTPAQQEILEITDIEVLRGLCLIADTMIQELSSTVEGQAKLIEEQDGTIERYQENAIGYRREIAASNKDSLRYELLKHILPSMMEVAAYAGARSDEAQEILGGIDILKLDGMLDSQLAAGALEEIYDELDRQAEDALNTEATQ